MDIEEAKALIRSMVQKRRSDLEISHEIAELSHQIIPLSFGFGGHSERSMIRELLHAEYRKEKYEGEI